jgi:tetratricopeptide (TPR) repeat protein
MRPGRTVNVAVGVVLALLAVVVLARPVARWLETPPSPAEAAVLLNRGRYDEAERALRRFLAESPGHREANLLMADVAINRPDPKPAAALECLDRIRSRDAMTRAAVLVRRGKALYMTSRLVGSESAWNEALALDPRVPEAGWLLIQQYYLQGREAEARGLALKLHPTETDAVDRVRYLLELAREDVERLSPAGILQWLEPAVRADSEDWNSAVALGRALVKEGRTDEGFRLLRRAEAGRPDDPAGWDALLNGLADVGDFEALGRELDRMPPALAHSPAVAAARGRYEQERGRIDEAVRALREALAARPFDPRLLHRTARALRQAGRSDEAKPLEAREADINEALNDLKAAYREAATIKTLGAVGEPGLYQRFAALRERLGKPDEALAWHRLVLRDDPSNAPSRSAVVRLTAAAPAPPSGG